MYGRRILHTRFALQIRISFLLRFIKSFTTFCCRGMLSTCFDSPNQNWIVDIVNPWLCWIVSFLIFKSNLSLCSRLSGMLWYCFNIWFRLLNNKLLRFNVRLLRSIVSLLPLLWFCIVYGSLKADFEILVEFLTTVIPWVPCTCPVVFNFTLNLLADP
jgi:hypothetical protein